MSSERRVQRVRRGEVFTTFHTAESFVNRVTGNQRDRHTHTPEYKVAAVRILPGGPPLCQ